MALITISGSVIPPPPGVDVNDIESIKSHIDLYQAKHFVFPFLAHALGTLVGAYIAAKFSATRRMTWAWVVGVFNLLGGIAAAVMIPAWGFAAFDLVLAYLPMAWLGGRMGSNNRS